MRSGRIAMPIAVVICAFLVLPFWGETASAIAQEKNNSVLDLLRKYQTTQTKVENQSSKERIVHFPEDRSLGNLLI